MTVAVGTPANKIGTLCRDLLRAVRPLGKTGAEQTSQQAKTGTTVRQTNTRTDTWTDRFIDG